MAGSESGSAGPLGTAVKTDSLIKERQRGEVNTCSAGQHTAFKRTDFTFTLVWLRLCLFVSGTLVTSCLELLVLGPATPGNDHKEGRRSEARRSGVAEEDLTSPV